MLLFDTNICKENTPKLLISVSRSITNIFETHFPCESVVTLMRSVQIFNIKICFAAKTHISHEWKIECLDFIKLFSKTFPVITQEGREA